MPTGFILGIASQDGSYLAELLLEKGYRVIGTVRGQDENTSYIDHFRSKLVIETLDLEHPESISALMQKYQPDEFYHLAALSIPAASWDQSYKTGLVTGLGPVSSLEAIRNYSPETRYFQPSTREIFGNPGVEKANEQTAINPGNPYAAAKAYAHFMTGIYRSNGVFAVNGILFNHESPRRPLSFVTRKITLAAACLGKKVTAIPTDPQGQPILGVDRKLHLWDTDSVRDRGFAGDYVEAMWRTLQQGQPQDFVIASGELHSVGEVCEAAFNFVGLNWQDCVVVDKKPSFSTPGLAGDSSKARKILGWSPKTGFRELIEMMVKSDLSYLDQLTP